MKRPGVFLLPAGWDASPYHGWYPFIHLGGERHCKSKCLAQEHSTMSRLGFKPGLLDPELNA